MARITVLGGNGFAGSNIVRTAAQRGHDVVSWSRSLPQDPVAGVDYRTGDVLDESVLAEAVRSGEVVVSALSPRGELEGEGILRGVESRVADLARTSGTRFGVVGGAGSLLVSPDGPRLSETDGFPPAFLAEAREMGGVLEDLRAGAEDLDWFFVSPAAGFGPWAAGEATGTYRTGGDVLLADDNGDSEISGPDLADALVREIEEPRHRRARFTVAY